MGRKRIHSEEYWKEYKRRKSAEWRAKNPERRKAQLDEYNHRPEVIERNRLRRKAIRDANREERMATNDSSNLDNSDS